MYSHSQFLHLSVHFSTAQVIEGPGGVRQIFSHANYFDEEALTKQLGSDDSDPSVDSSEPCAPHLFSCCIHFCFYNLFRSLEIMMLLELLVLLQVCAAGAESLNASYI